MHSAIVHDVFIYTTKWHSVVDWNCENGKQMFEMHTTRAGVNTVNDEVMCNIGLHLHFSRVHSHHICGYISVYACASHHIMWVHTSPIQLNGACTAGRHPFDGKTLWTHSKALNRTKDFFFTLLFLESNLIKCKCCRIKKKIRQNTHFVLE